MILIRNTITTSCCILWLMLASCHKPQNVVVMGLPFQSQVENNWGIIATNGSLLIPDTYKYRPTAAINNMFWVQDADMYWQLHTISNPQHPVTTRKYAQAGYFFEEVTLAQKEFGMPFLVVNKLGEEIERIDAYGSHSIMMAHNFSNGLALVCTDELKYGYINTLGEIHIKPVYDMAFDFSDGLAIVGMSNANGQMAWSAINKQGKVEFHLSLANSQISEKYTCGRLAYRNRKWGYCGVIGKDGKSLYQLSDKVENIWPYKYDAAICLTTSGVGLVDDSGEIQIQPNYQNGKIVGPERAAFLQNGRWGLFTFQGKPLTIFEYDDILEFYDSEHAFVRQGNAWLQIDYQGKITSKSAYPVIHTDAIISRQHPQIFLRTNHRTKEETTGKNDIDPIRKEEQPSVEPAGKVVPPTLEPAMNRATVLKEISKRSPFYEEARRIVSSGLPEEDKQNRCLILDYVEHFRTAYTTKDIDFLNQLFSEEALIIVGKVVQRAPRQENQLLSRAQVVYNVRSKKEYLTRLKSVFATNQDISVYFEQFHIMKHPTIESFYGVSLKQGYRSDSYSDEGYLFLLWDFRDKLAPAIHVRTWQPAMLDANTPLPVEEVFNLGSFHLQ